MTQTLSQFLKQNLVEPPKTLYPSVMTVLEEHSRRQRRNRLLVFFACGSLSLLGVIGASISLAQEMARSGFLQYTALIGSDTFMVVAHAKVFLLLLAESMPVVGLVFFFGAMFLFLETFRFLQRLPQKVEFFSIRHAVR